MKTRDRIIVALDAATGAEALGLVRRLKGQVGVFKIGSQLYTAEGPEIVRQVIEMGEKVFLDLKFHDIPNTVSGAVASASRLGVSMLTLHTSGGLAMLKAAVQRIQGSLSQNERPMLLGVTVLTSMGEDDLLEVGVNTSSPIQVDRLAGLAQRAGLDGVVASPLELAPLHHHFGGALKFVIPGIRPSGFASDDQTRTATPAEAIRAGADYLVIGRPITASPDPAEAAQRIIESIELETAPKGG
ncbi:MAG: orotidine-5'-phosphate decarboxylase [Terriglobia bacterium]